MQERIQNIVRDNRFSLFMLLCIAAYACLKFPFRAIADVFQTLFLLGFIMCLVSNHRSLTQEAVFKVFLLSLTFPVLSWINSTLSIPDLANPSPSLSDAIGLFYFLPIAFLVAKSRTAIYVVWAAFSIGLLISVFHYSPSVLDEIKAGVSGERIDFGFYNLQHASAWAGACLIIIAGITIKQLSQTKIKSSIAMIVTAIPFGFIFIATQTRQTFLGLFVALILVSIFYILKLRISKSKAIISLTVFALISAITFNYSGIKERTLSESDTYVSVLTGEYNDFKNAREGSTVRFALWYAGFQWVKERPFLGSGREISEHIIKVSPYTPDSSKGSNHRHLHSYYMEILVSYGIYGLTIVLGLFALVYSNLFKARISESFDEVQFVGLVFIPYWLIVNIFEPQLLTSPGQLIHNVMLGSFFFFAQSKTDRLTS